MVKRKNGSTYAEAGSTCAEVDTRKNRLTYADRHLESKEGEAQSWTQEDHKRKISEDEVRCLKREEKETWNWTKEDPEGRMSNDTKAFVEAQQVW